MHPHTAQEGTAPEPPSFMRVTIPSTRLHPWDLIPSKRPSLLRSSDGELSINNLHSSLLFTGSEAVPDQLKSALQWLWGTEAQGSNTGSGCKPPVPLSWLPPRSSILLQVPCGFRTPGFQKRLEVLDTDCTCCFSSGNNVQLLTGS